MTPKAKLVVLLIVFFSRSSLANFTYSKYELQQVGAKTLITKLSIDSRIACGIACKATENCAGFWYNQSLCHLFSKVYNGSETMLYFDTSQEFLYPSTAPRFLLASANPYGYFTEFDSDKPEKNLNKDVQTFNCFVLFNDTRSVIFHSKLATADSPHVYNFEDQSIFTGGTYKNPHDHTGGTLVYLINVPGHFHFFGRFSTRDIPIWYRDAYYFWGNFCPWKKNRNTGVWNFSQT